MANAIQINRGDKMRFKVKLAMWLLFGEHWKYLYYKLNNNYDIRVIYDEEIEFRIRKEAIK